ncbi:uncharacterized protein LOC110156442 isoform X2 [Boleophthalmus pectinirostris]|uniref:uncharacterized protein LOC110156442 isoform X2 n=1 Tax=Boleophthalmus pectinirostris TaxID=150288 RepID=UPI002431D088|nr:uncharacterized protein LOC110156442 isoform X2 [Boleophthalmus pectinirostris]
MSDDTDEDFIDSNYIWQRRIWRVLKNRQVSSVFPYATAIGIEFNPAFERAQKIPVDLVNNGAILDMHSFVKSVNKSPCYHLFDILQFHFDIRLSPDSPECGNFANKVYSTAKFFYSQLRGRLKLYEKLQEVFVLPKVTPENRDLPSENTQNMQFYDDRKGDPIFMKKGPGYIYKLSMSNYPLCKKLGITFVLRPSNTPEQKLSTKLLTLGMILEMLDFVESLGGRYLQMLKELILHNFGEVFEPCYLSLQVRTVYDKKLATPLVNREAFFEETFQFMLRKHTMKRTIDLDSEIEVVPEKRRSTVTHLSSDFLWDEKPAEGESSYMCPVDFDADLETNVDSEDIKIEDTVVDVETVFPESEILEKEDPTYHYSVRNKRPRKIVPELPILDLFCDDTLPMSQKSVKQKEWTIRSNRIIEILRKGTESNLMFCRSREIGLDFNVASGRAKHLDKQLLTNHTLYEVHKFCSHLSRGLVHFLLNIIESNFNFQFQDSFQSYLFSREKCILNQVHIEPFMSMPIQFPEIYISEEVTAEFQNEKMSDNSPDEDLSEEFPYCKKIGLNLWSRKGRLPGRMLHLNTLTNGALLEIFSFSRRLCSKPQDLMHDVLEHNFDMKLQNSASEEAKGLSRWLNGNKFIIKKPFCLIKTNHWLIEVVNLKNYGAVIDKHSNLEEASPLPMQTAKKCTYGICKEIGLDLNLSCKSATKQKLDLKLLTRGALFETHRRVEFAWSVAAQVLAMVRKSARRGDYMNRVFELPFEAAEGEICKEEEEKREIEAPDECSDDVIFVQKFIPVDIDVDIE